MVTEASEGLELVRFDRGLPKKLKSDIRSYILANKREPASKRRRPVLHGQTFAPADTFPEMSRAADVRIPARQLLRRFLGEKKKASHLTILAFMSKVHR